MKDRKSGRGQLFENIVALYLLQGLNYLIPLAVLPYLVRTIGLERYGLIAVAQATVQYFTLLTDYGFNYSATRAISRQRDDAAEVSRLFSSVLVIKLIMMFVGFVLLVAIVYATPRFTHNSRFFFVAYLAVVGNVLFPLWFFQGMEQMRYISIINGLPKLIGAAALFVFVHRPADALLALGIQSLSLTASGLAGLWIALRYFNLSLAMPRFVDLRVTLSEGWHLFVSTAALSLYTNTNVFLVGLISGNLEAGYFSAAEKMTRALQALINPAIQAVFPRTSALAAESRQRALRFAFRTLKWIGLFSLVVSIATLILAKPIVILLFGASAKTSIIVFRWIAFLPFLGAVSSVLGIQTMVSLGLDKQFSRILIVGGIFNVLLAVMLIRIYAAAGAGVSVLLTEILVASLIIVSLLRRERDFRTQETETTPV